MVGMVVGGEEGEWEKGEGVGGRGGERQRGGREGRVGEEKREEGGEVWRGLEGIGLVEGLVPLFGGGGVSSLHDP